MEKGEKEVSDFQWTFMPQNPIDSVSNSISPRESHRLVAAHSLENHNDGNCSSGYFLDHQSTAATINPRVQIHPAATSQNQNPINTGSVNFQDTMSGMDLNPRLNQETLLGQGLETSLSRLRLSTLSHQSWFLAPQASQEDIWSGTSTGPSLGNSLYDNYDGISGGFVPSTHAREFQEQQYLEKHLRELYLQSIRIQSAVKGQMGRDIILSNGASRSSSFANYQRRNLSSAGPSFEKAKNHSAAASSSSNFSNGFDWHRQRQSADTMSYDYPIWPSSPSCNGIGYDSNLSSQKIFSNGLGSVDAGILSLQPSQQHPTSYTSMEELNGQLFSAANDRSRGYAFFQKKFEKRKDDLHASMVNPSYYHQVQNRFQESDEEELTEILLDLISNEHRLKHVCTDSQGSRSIQNLLEHLKRPDHISLVILAIRNLTLTLAKSQSGQFVIKKCLELFPAQDIELILNEVAKNCFDIATDRHGCCVIQQCVSHAFGETRDRLVDEIVANALLLSEDAYGNFVVQQIIGLKMSRAAEAIYAQLKERFLSLSMNRHSSHVVQKCLKEFEEKLSTRIIRELISSDPGCFLSFLQDQWGNYVAQTAKAVSKGSSVHQSLMNLIDGCRPFLESHPYGKCVLATKGKQHRLV